jgi:hypothetical protein
VSDEDKVLARVLDEATSFLGGWTTAGGRAGRRRPGGRGLGGTAARVRERPLEVVEALIAGAEPGIVAMPSGGSSAG